MDETNNILSLLENYTFNNADDIAKEMAADFRKRRIEKNLTRDLVAEKSGVAVSNIVRFEQKGLISLKNLIGIAMALGYTSEIKNIFAQPKYATMEELLQIRKNMNKKIRLLLILAMCIAILSPGCRPQRIILRAMSSGKSSS